MSENNSQKTETPRQAPVKVRIAPSPTGDPHIGTAYVAVFNYMFAQKHGGHFVVRIEDTDQQRYRADSEAAILKSLRWLGLSWHEGPDIPPGQIPGAKWNGPYRQSERLHIYKEYAAKLVETGHAYPCFCTPERLQELRKKQQESKEAAESGYDGHCRDIAPHEARARVAQNERHTIRLKMPHTGQTVVEDQLRGTICFENSMVDDQVLMKSDGFPTYHLAVVVDDHLMGITHVIRGEEWITSTPKHVQLYESFGWPKPVYMHLPLLRNADKSKISKRKNPTNILYYKRKGILPEALVNFLALLGYHPEGDKEKYSLAELCASFDASRIHLGGPVFDFEKLAWLNGLYLRELSAEDFLKRLRSELLSDDYLLKVVPLLQERIDTLDQFFARGDFFFGGDLDLTHVELVPKKADPKLVQTGLEKLLDQFDSDTAWTLASVEACFTKVMAENGLKPKDLLMPARLAVTGRKDSPPLYETVQVLGKEIVRRRLRTAVTLLAAQNQP